MAKLDKSLCKLKKEDLEENLKEFKKLVSVPKYFCKKCGRVSAKKKNLCKAEAL